MEGNVLFNDALNTIYLWLYDVGHMVKDHLDSKRGNLLPPLGLIFLINNCADRIVHTMASDTSLAETRNSSMGPP